MQIKDVARTTRRDAAGEIRRLAIAVALADALAGDPQLSIMDLSNCATAPRTWRTSVAPSDDALAAVALGRSTSP